MNPILPAAAAAAAALLVVAGAGPTPEEATLKSLAGIRVVVAPLAKQLEQRGLRAEALHGSIESQLRKAGIVLLAADERAQGMPTLTLHLVGLTTDPDEQFVYSVDLALHQDVRLVRNPSLRLSAPTWRSTGSVGAVDLSALAAVKQVVAEQVDQFIAAHRTANSL